MEIKLRIIIILIVFISNFQINTVYALIHDDYKQPVNIDCSDGVRVNFDASTFDEPVEIICKRIDQNQGNSSKQSENIVSPVYNLEITSKDKDKTFNFFRKEATINIPKSLLVDIDSENSDRSIFFYDLNIKDWVSYNTSDTNNYLQAKLMHTGNFAVLYKTYDTNIDIYSTIAYYIIIVGISIYIIYAIIVKKYDK